MIRILVTGKTGQVASALLALSRPEGGIEVITIGRPEIDLSEPTSIASAVAAARPSVVVNAAAYTAVDRAESEGDLALSVNGTGAGAVAKAAADFGVPIIQISTDYVFDGTKQTPYLETDIPRPLSIYGASKLAGKKSCCGSQSHACDPADFMGPFLWRSKLPDHDAQVGEGEVGFARCRRSVGKPN